MANSSYEDSAVGTEARLLIHHPGGAPHAVELDPSHPQTIGRGQDCTLRLLDEHCSRLHCVIEWRNGNWFITDRGSRNGTLVNAERIREHVLDEGDVIVVGGTWLVFTMEDEDTAAKVFDAGQESDTNVNVPTFNPNARTTTAVPAPRSNRRFESELDSETRMAAMAEETARIGRSPVGRNLVRSADPILGHSPAIRSVLNQVASVAPTESTVLLRGESGVGKEMVARAIHVQSRRRN